MAIITDDIAIIISEKEKTTFSQNNPRNHSLKFFIDSNLSHHNLSDLSPIDIEYPL